MNMMLAHNAHSVPYAVINDHLPVRPAFGLYIYEIGSYGLELGYDVEIKCLNTHFMGTSLIGASSAEIGHHIQTHRDEDYYQEKWRNHQAGLDTIIEFIDRGGELTAGIPVARDIKNAIDDGHPVMVAVTTNFLYDKYFRHNEHFVIISGYDDDNFLINDPGKNAEGKKQIFPVEHVMYGIYANASRSVEGGSIMMIKPSSFPTPH